MTPNKVLYALLSIIFLLLSLHLLSYAHLQINGLTEESYFFRKFNFDSERNVPAIFSGILHLTASLILVVIGLNNKTHSYRWFWFILSFVFLFLGLDEILVIHEKVEGNLKFLEERGTFFYNWIIVYAGAGLLLLLIFLKPLLSLPRSTLFRFIGSGLLFVFGAVVLESIAGNLVFQKGLPPHLVKITPEIFILATFEELLEMLGVSIFIFALLQYFATFKVASHPKHESSQSNYERIKVNN